MTHATYQPSELIIRPDGGIYHLGLLPEDLPDHVITVGDPERVQQVSQHFDKITKTVSHREFISHIGTIGQKDVMCISTGIGTDNIDIVLNELDALANIDFNTRVPKKQKRSLNIYRLGTSGTVRPDINVDEMVISAYGVGFDGLAFYYNIGTRESELENMVNKVISEELPEVKIYASPAGQDAFEKFSRVPKLRKGITMTLPGFYGPQGRLLRAGAQSIHFIDMVAAINYKGFFVTNLEMETSGIYYLASALGHNALSLNAILANRSSKVFSANPTKTVEKLIKMFFENF